MTNIKLHPELARIIGRAINDRSVASDTINLLLYSRRPFNEEAYNFWRDQHKQATAILAELGINLHSFDKDVREAFR